MSAVRRILVAVKDPAARGRAGVRKAARLARAMDAELTLFHSIVEPDIESRAGDVQRERLERCARRLRRAGLRVAVSVACDYPAYEAVLREACRIGAGLVVAELHPGRHLAAGLLHLNDWELLRRSPMPVLLVKDSRPYRAPAVLAAVDPDHTYAKPPRLNQQILRLGAAVARALHGALHAAYAYDPVPPLAFSGGALSDQAVIELETRCTRTARAKLERTVRSAGVPRSRQHILGLHPVDAIAQLAASTGSAIVVMGAISRSGLRRMLIGNTAERLLDRLSCDALIVKPAGLVKPPPRARRVARHHGLQPRLY